MPKQFKVQSKPLPPLVALGHVGGLMGMDLEHIPKSTDLSVLATPREVVSAGQPSAANMVVDAVVGQILVMAVVAALAGKKFVEPG